jgi:hypothetical protein
MACSLYIGECKATQKAKYAKRILVARIGYIRQHVWSTQTRFELARPKPLDD